MEKIEENELDKVVPTDVTLKIKGKERKIKFGFSAWAKIEKEYGGMKNISKMQKQIEEEPFATIPHLLYLGLQDKEGVTEENILDDYGLGDMEYIAKIFSQALYGSLPQDEKKTSVKKEVPETLL